LTYIVENPTTVKLPRWSRFGRMRFTELVTLTVTGVWRVVALLVSVSPLQLAP
jgi:hypothetical protein